MKQRETARIHLLVAKEAPIAVIIRRKPSKRFHIIKWHLDSDQFEHGSWFSGKLYPLRSDLSWDGELMTYLALGDSGQTWCGVSQAPWLKTILESKNHGTYDGGGVFWERNKYLANQRYPLPIETQPEWPQRISIGWIGPGFNGEDLSIIFHRLHRDGWRMNVDGKSVAVLDDDGGILTRMPSPSDHPHHWKFSNKHPTLQVRYVGYRSESVGDPTANTPIYAGRSGYLFHFELLDYPELLGPQVDWATWTSQGDLIWTKYGVVYRQNLKGLIKGEQPKSFDFNHLEPPPRPKLPSPTVI